MTTQTFDGYYVFEADQVLTNDHLNQQFYYLDWQERLTRNKLIGTGIVCGLDITSAADKITISKGSGVTSEGYLILLEAPLNFDYFVQYKGVPQPADLPFGPDLPTGYVLPFFDIYCTNTTVYQLLDSTQYNTQNPLPAGSAALTTLTLSNYAVVLFLELNEKDLKNCDTQDCNNKGEKMEITIRALLVPVSALPNPFVTSKAKEIKLARYNVPYAPLNNAGDVLTAFYNILNNGILNNLAASYAYCYDRYSSFLTDTQNPFSNPGFSLAQQLNQALTDLWNNTNRITVQYLYDYINDLALAYYEFRETASGALLSQCVGHELDFPLHLVLGAANSSTSDTVADPYRTYFIYSPIVDAQNQGMAKTRFLFNRMKMLATDFKINTYTSINNIIITPSQYMDFPLSERCIPFYYNPAAVNGVAINQVWNYYKTLNDNDDFILGYNASTYNSDDSIVSPLLYDIEQYNFFRIEGHIGQQYTDVLSFLINEQLKYNLPFDIVAVSAELLTSSNTTNVPECSIVDLESEFRLLLTEFLSKLFLCIYKFAILPYDSTNLNNQQGVFTLANNLPDIDNNLFINDFNLEFDTYAYGDFYAKYAPFSAIVVTTIGSAYVKSLQTGAIDKTGVFRHPVGLDFSENASYVLGYNLQFEFLNLVDSMFYQLLNNDLADFDSTTFTTTYERFNTLLQRFMLMAKDSQSTIFNGCGCDCLVTIVERILILLAEYQTRLNNYLAQLSFLNYYKKHPGLEHKAGVPKGGTFVLVYHEEVTTPGNGLTFGRLPVFTDLPTKVAALKDVNIEKIPTAADTTTTTTNAPTYTIDENTLQLITDFVDQCKDAPDTTKQTILKHLPPFHIGPPQQFPSIANGAVIADFYIPYQCCSDCAPIAYVMDNKLNVYTVSGGGSTCAANATNANSGIAPVMLSGSDTDVTYNLYNSSDSTFKVTMTGTGNPLNFGIPTAAGTYTVTAVSTDGNTKVNMNGSAVVKLNQPPTIFNLKAANNETTYCMGVNGVDLFLDGSESGAQYQLFNGTTADPAGPVTGTGALLDFGIKTSGTYTVVATNPTTTCTSNMNGSVTVTANPPIAVFNVTPPGTTTYPAGTPGVDITLAGSGPSTIGYQLYDNGAPVSGVQIMGLDGQPLDFGIRPAGVYTVVATDLNTKCMQNMNGTATIVQEIPVSLELKSNSLCIGNPDQASGNPGGGTYSSGSPTVATVDPNSGLITTLAGGITQITYTLADGRSASQTLAVGSVPVIKISFDPLGPQNAAQIPVMIYQNEDPLVINADIVGGTWSVSDSTKATITPDGQTVKIVGGNATGIFTLYYRSPIGCVGSIDMNNGGEFIQ